ncbi:carboxypeptidase-like regulatory domain-containing protein [Daejeonella lutea]|uniref:CarboxypepD_reg-like domain-containing protein n=1 Tax=Daejeonella lutea TaxID=572036 RepID=A0A1T5A485_9SPHI|nr:carboxypeptidase-like regulatory domain-containing protein [Daejeonella lutea]SKB29599.1 CarboxypepD_reg-like domain-containing protein [Daejeonella lutea]
MKSLLVVFLMLIGTLQGLAQTTFEGTIKESSTNKPLSYVNIGVIGKNVGTVSDDEGKFKLTIPSSYSNETVRVSMIGYGTLNYKVSEFAKVISDQQIVMRPSMYELPAVVVSNKKLKEKILGNTTESQTTTAGFTSNKLGNELGIVIKIKKSPTFIKSFQASVVSKDNNPVKLRLNFYNVKDGLPDKLIQDKNIIVSAPVQNGKLVVDLQQYNIVAEDDFFVSLEWIENDSGRIVFSSSILKGAIIARETSQGAWEKVGMFGIGFTVKAAW